MELFVTVCWIIIGMTLIAVFTRIIKAIYRSFKSDSNKKVENNITNNKKNTNNGKTITCIFCGKNNDYGEIYCSACGQKLDYSKKCKKCNGLNEPNATHCTYCGEKFDE